jgi:hypothetical protein
MMAFCFSASFPLGVPFFIPLSLYPFVHEHSHRSYAGWLVSAAFGCVSVTALQSVPAYDLLYFGACWLRCTAEVRACSGWRSL